MKIQIIARKFGSNFAWRMAKTGRVFRMIRVTGSANVAHNKKHLADVSCPIKIFITIDVYHQSEFEFHYCMTISSKSI